MSFSWLNQLKVEIYMLVRIVVAIDIPMHQKIHSLSVLILIGSQFIQRVAHLIGLPFTMAVFGPEILFCSLKEQLQKDVLLIP